MMKSAEKSHDSVDGEKTQPEEETEEDIQKQFEKSKLEPEITINQNSNIVVKDGCTIYE